MLEGRLTKALNCKVAQGDKTTNLQGSVMEAGNFFVMLNTQGGGYTPLMRDDEIAQFNTEHDAEMCAKGNLLGSHFGFEVFERGTGNAF